MGELNYVAYMNYAYCKCTVDDAFSVIEFLKELHSDHPTTILRRCDFPSIEDEKRWIASHSNGGFIECCKVGHEVVGLIDAKRLTPIELSHNLCLSVSVLSSHRRKGIATNLVNHAVDWAIADGVSRIELEVFGNNLSAVEMYGKLGFEIDGNRKMAIRLYNGNYVDLLHMTKIIV